MERTTTFASNNEHGITERQRAEDIDHAIMTASEVARRLSQESNPVDSEVISSERSDAEDRSSVRTDGGEERASNEDKTADVDDHKYWYGVALGERTTVNTR